MRMDPEIYERLSMIATYSDVDHINTTSATTFRRNSITLRVVAVCLALSEVAAR